MTGSPAACGHTSRKPWFSETFCLGFPVHFLTVTREPGGAGVKVIMKIICDRACCWVNAIPILSCEQAFRT